MAQLVDPPHPRRDDRVIGLVVAPTIWALHFLVCYVFTAVWCAKVSDGGLDVPRIVIAVATLLALGGIGLVSLRVFNEWGFTLEEEEPRHDEDTIRSRHAFLSRATFLLCGLSAVATVYVAIPALFLSSCR